MLTPTRAALLMCACLTLFAAGCRTSNQNRSDAPRQAAPLAVRQALDVLIEEGKPAEMEPRQYAYRLELRNYMETELPRRFAKYGLDARIIRQRSEHAGPAGGRHLLVVHFDSYNPGSTAARIAVGFGAGAASLDLSMALFKGEAAPLSWKDGCGTSGHWSRIINKLDDNMAKKLASVYGQR